MADRITAESKALEEKLIQMRRQLHEIPEIGGRLPKTRALVCKRLEELNIPYRLNSGDDGLVADICGAAPGKTIAFRADMDALHLEERTGLPYASGIPGQMHGCGHDAHTAILLATAELLQKLRGEFRGTVRLLFQAGEETGTGAKQMLAEGALAGVDAVCALHVGDVTRVRQAAGTLTVLPGPVSAGKDKFTITVHGKGTHSAFPEQGVDPILVAARIVNACEETAARELPAGTAAVLSFGSFQAGEDHNTIPDAAVLKGSIRAQSVEVRDFLGQRLQDICRGIAEAFRAECTVDLKRGSATVINDEKLSALVAEAAREVLGDARVVTRLPAALMGSDDFANYAERIAGVYFFLQTNDPENGMTAANHSPEFRVEESVLWEGVAAYTGIALKFLA